MHWRPERSDRRDDNLTRVGDPEPLLPNQPASVAQGPQADRSKDLGKYVRDRDAAIVLGKALFWDMQAGSDGQACASCPFTRSPTLA